MGSRYLTNLADICRGAGLVVVEVEGWHTRARSSGGYDGNRPWCVMWHHTASNASPADDVAYIATGSSDAPLSNLYLARDGTVYVIAAGCTNTNGKGGPLSFTRGTVEKDTMNNAAIGVEAANTGTGEVWSQRQVDAYFRLSNALARGYGLAPTDLATHQEYAPTRKVDPAVAAAVHGPWRPRSVTSAGSWNPDDIRAEASRRAEPDTEEDDDMRHGPFLIQATGRDGTPAGRVYATDGNLQTLRWLPTEEALAGYRWQARAAGWSAPELNDGAPIEPIDTIAAFGAVITD